MKKPAVRVVLLFLVIVIAVSAILFLNIRESSAYRLDYREFVAAAGAEFSVPEEVIFSIIKTESGFDSNAVSRSGARGLMQLIPSTFDEIAERLHEYPDKNAVFDPETNIRFGTYYISLLYKSFKSWDTAIAAYNAGIGNVREWLADSRYSADGITLSEMPFGETRSYVGQVTKSIKIYKKLLEENNNG